MPLRLCGTGNGCEMWLRRTVTTLNCQATMPPPDAEHSQAEGLGRCRIQTVWPKKKDSFFAATSRIDHICICSAAQRPSSMLGRRSEQGGGAETRKRVHSQYATISKRSSVDGLVCLSKYLQPAALSGVGSLSRELSSIPGGRENSSSPVYEVT